MDLDCIRDLLYEVKGLGFEFVEFEGESWIDDIIILKRVVFVRFDFCEFLLIFIVEKIGKVGVDWRDVGNIEIESDFCLLFEDMYVV